MNNSDVFRYESNLTIFFFGISQARIEALKRAGGGETVDPRIFALRPGGNLCMIDPHGDPGLNRCDRVIPKEAGILTCHWLQKIFPEMSSLRRQAAGMTEGLDILDTQYGVI
jgi:hypothetical protein